MHYMDYDDNQGIYLSKLGLFIYWLIIYLFIGGYEVHGRKAYLQNSKLRFLNKCSSWQVYQR